MNRWLSLSVGLLAAPLLSGAALAAKLSLVVDDARPVTQKVIEALERQAGTGNSIEVFNLQTVDWTNPLDRGRFLSRLAAADLVIPIGDPASRMVSRELEDTKTFFIAAAGFAGDYLNQDYVTGILSYSPAETVRVAKALLPRLRTIGVLYTPGYEDVVARMRTAAAGNGLSLLAREVKHRRDLGPATRETAGAADVLWVVGDPAFTDELSFTYLLQETLALKKPLAAPLPDLVDRGGLFCTIPDSEKLAAQASSALARLLAANLEISQDDRIQPAPEPGLISINRRLADKWNIRIPHSLPVWNHE